LVAEVVQLGVDGMQIAVELTALPLPGQSILLGVPALLPIFFRPFQIGLDQVDVRLSDSRRFL
jgi:hypothetical protein